MSNKETGRQFSESEIERICELSMGSNVPPIFDRATDKAFADTISSVQKDAGLILKLWREVAFRVFENEFETDHEAYYALLYARSMAFGKQLAVKKFGRFLQEDIVEEIEKNFQTNQCFMAN